MLKVSAVPPRRSAVLTVFGGATAINDGTTAEPLRNHGDHSGATAVYVVQASQWHRAFGVTGGITYIPVRSMNHRPGPTARLRLSHSIDSE